MARRHVKRSYDATARRVVAAETRNEILRVAYGMFVRLGFTATKVADIAEEAGVAVDTIYASVGTKRALFRTLVENAISGGDSAVPAEARAYVKAIRQEPDARRKLALYAGAIRSIHERLAPLIRVLKDAASGEDDLATLWKSISDRRAANMKMFATDLAASGALREGVGIDEVADVIWATNAPEFYLLLVHERGWAPERFENWLSDAWSRLLLR
jgi:AcrR family transcriptional regulator